MRRFLVVLDHLRVSRSEVKSGRNNPDVITAARCVNVGLFVSGGLREDVAVTLGRGPLEDLTAISFAANDLRRVSPDERSITFFLLKASEVADQLEPTETERMDNGIRVERNSLLGLVDHWDIDSVHVANAEENAFPIYRENSNDPLFIYCSRQLTPDIIDALPDAIIVPRPPHPERFILDVNMHSDRQVQGS